MAVLLLINSIFWPNRLTPYVCSRPAHDEIRLLMNAFRATNTAFPFTYRPTQIKLNAAITGIKQVNAYLTAFVYRICGTVLAKRNSRYITKYVYAVVRDAAIL